MIITNYSLFNLILVYHIQLLVFYHDRTWVSLGLPVCRSLLRRSSDYMCQIVDRYISACQHEAGQLSGVLLSIKCIRTCKV